MGREQGNESHLDFFVVFIWLLLLLKKGQSRAPVESGCQYQALSGLPTARQWGKLVCVCPTPRHVSPWVGQIAHSSYVQGVNGSQALFWKCSNLPLSPRHLTHPKSHPQQWDLNILCCHQTKTSRSALSPSASLSPKMKLRTCSPPPPNSPPGRQRQAGRRAVSGRRLLPVETPYNGLLSSFHFLKAPRPLLGNNKM